MADRPVVDALGKAVVTYPFMVLALVVVIALEATDDGGPGDFLGWLIWGCCGWASPRWAPAS